jgi:hypothetical protein
VLGRTKRVFGFCRAFNGHFVIRGISSLQQTLYLSVFGSNITGKLTCIKDSLHQNRLASSLQKMTDPFVLCVEVSGVGTVYMLHYQR